MKKKMFLSVTFYIGTAILFVGGILIPFLGGPYVGLSYFLVALGSLTLIFVCWIERKVFSRKPIPFLILIGTSVMLIVPDSWNVARITIACPMVVVALVGIVKMLILSKKDGTKAT